MFQAFTSEHINFLFAPLCALLFLDSDILGIQCVIYTLCILIYSKYHYDRVVSIVCLKQKKKVILLLKSISKSSNSRMT